MARTDDLKNEAADARRALVDSIGELGAIARDAKGEAVETAKRYAPMVGGAIASLVLLRAGASRRRRKRAS